MLTYQVIRAQKRLHLEYKYIIVIVFRSVGISLNPNRSKDIKLKIKALNRIVIGDQYQYNILQEEEEDIVAVQIV